MSNVDIYAILASKDHNPVYLKNYHKFILKCRQVNKSLPKGTYFEKHHICPKATDMFPEYKSFGSFPWNKIKLTAPQHFIAHKLLWKAYRGSQALAFKVMNDVDGKKINEFEYEQLKLDNRKHCSGKSVYVDSNGKKIKCRTDDPRILSGELKSNACGKTRNAESLAKHTETSRNNRVQNDLNEYDFYNVETKEKIRCNRAFLEHKTGLRLYKLTTEPQLRIYDWIILKNDEIPERYLPIKLYHISGEVIEIQRNKIYQKFGDKLEPLFNSINKNKDRTCHGWSLIPHTIKLFIIQHKDGSILKMSKDQILNKFGKGSIEIFRKIPRAYKGWSVISHELIPVHP